MPNELDSRRLEVLLKFESACARLRAYHALLDLLAQRAHGLLEFERLSILLCDNDRQILKTIIVEDHTSREANPSEIPSPDLDLISEALTSGATLSGGVATCAPMISAGRTIGALCLSARDELYYDPDVRFVQLLADSLAATFERVAPAGAIIDLSKDAASAAGRLEASTEAAHAESLRMSYLARHDELTDLPNRWLLNERLVGALALSVRYRRRLAVLFLDLDKFKEINDTLGHSIGDQVLRQISDRLVRCVRSSDTVSRIGGDEFVILLAELEDEKDVTVCAGKIIAAVRAPLKINSHELQLTVSVGISIYPGDGEVSETLIRKADTAMYRAKAEGNGKCCLFKPDMNAAAGEQRPQGENAGLSLVRAKHS